MRQVAAVFALGIALAALPQLSSLDALTGAALTLAIGVITAVLAAGRGALSIAFGALGALAYTYLAPRAPELAAAVFVAGAHGARSLRGRTLPLRGAHALASLVAGLLAGLVLARYQSADAGVLAAAAVVAGLLSATPLAIPADDPTTFALAGLASESDEPARSLLFRAVAVRRRVDAATMEVLPDKVAEQLENSWSALLDTARARATARSTATLLDKRIARFVEVLERIYTAAEERAARAAGLDDKALLQAKMEGDRLEAEVSALIEVSTSVRVESEPSASADQSATASNAAADVPPQTAATNYNASPNI